MTRTITKEPPGPDPVGRRPFVPTLAPVTCAHWCTSGDGHPDAVSPAEQLCSGVELRLDPKHGGGIAMLVEYANVLLRQASRQVETLAS